MSAFGVKRTLQSSLTIRPKTPGNSKYTFDDRQALPVTKPKQGYESWLNALVAPALMGSAVASVTL